MYNIIGFFIRYKNTLLFLFLLGISLALSIQTHSYQKSKFISSTNAVTGGIYSWSHDVDVYFHLREYNTRLRNENQRLHQELFNLQAVTKDTSFLDTLHYASEYTVYPAEVIANNYRGIDNYILLDRGSRDSLTEELGVITSNGIVGVIENTSPNYARVISILNSKLPINAQLKKSDHFGTLSWNGKNPNIMQLTDVPKTAKIKKGDTVMTNGRSLIFPKGIPIGTITDFKLDDEQNYYEIAVKLFNDMTNIGNVYVIKNNSRPEIDSLRQADE